MARHPLCSRAGLVGRASGRRLMPRASMTRVPVAATTGIAARRSHGLPAQPDRRARSPPTGPSRDADEPKCPRKRSRRSPWPHPSRETPDSACQPPIAAVSRGTLHIRPPQPSSLRTRISAWWRDDAREGSRRRPTPLAIAMVWPIVPHRGRRLCLVRPSVCDTPARVRELTSAPSFLEPAHRDYRLSSTASPSRLLSDATVTRASRRRHGTS